MYALSEDTEMKAKLTTLTRRLEELEMRNQHEMQVANELSAPQSSCFNYQSNSHPGEHCQEHAHILNRNKPPINAPYGNTYNPNWRNHPTCHGSQNPLHMSLQEHSSSLAPLQHNNSRLHFLLLLSRRS